MAAKYPESLISVLIESDVSDFKFNFGVMDTRSLLKYITTSLANYINDKNSKWMPNYQML